MSGRRCDPGWPGDDTAAKRSAEGQRSGAGRKDEMRDGAVEGGCATARETTALLAVTTMKDGVSAPAGREHDGTPAISDPQKISCHGETIAPHERAQTDSAMGPMRKGEMRFASASDRVSVATSASASTTASRRCFRSTSTMGGPN
jgi:hypothetical protein